jgi:hypothetical protein
MSRQTDRLCACNLTTTTRNHWPNDVLTTKVADEGTSGTHVGVAEVLDQA